MPKLDLDIPLVNACGILSYLDVLQRLERDGAVFGAWVPKSIGPFSKDPELRRKYGWQEERTGNPNPVIYHTGHVLMILKNINCFANFAIDRIFFKMHRSRKIQRISVILKKKVTWVDFNLCKNFFLIS